MVSAYRAFLEVPAVKIADSIRFHVGHMNPNHHIPDLGPKEPLQNDNPDSLAASHAAMQPVRGSDHHSRHTHLPVAFNGLLPDYRSKRPRVAALRSYGELWLFHNQALKNMDHKLQVKKHQVATCLCRTLETIKPHHYWDILQKESHAAPSNRLAT